MEKRRREQTRKQNQQDKEQRRLKRIAERKINPAAATDPATATDKDPDLAGLVPGPQPGQII